MENIYTYKQQTEVLEEKTELYKHYQQMMILSGFEGNEEDREKYKKLMKQTSSELFGVLNL